MMLSIGSISFMITSSEYILHGEIDELKQCTVLHLAVIYHHIVAVRQYTAMPTFMNTPTNNGLYFWWCDQQSSLNFYFLNFG